MITPRQLEQHAEAGLTSLDIAMKHGMRPSHVRALCSKWGLKLVSAKRMTPAKDRIRELLHKGNAPAEIEKYTGYSLSYIEATRLEMQREGIKLALNRGSKFDLVMKLMNKKAPQ